MRAAFWSGAIAGAVVGFAELVELLAGGQAPGSFTGLIGALLALVAIGTATGVAWGGVVGLAGAVLSPDRPWGQGLRAMGRGLAAGADPSPGAAAGVSGDPTWGARRIYGGVLLAGAAYGALFGVAVFVERYSNRTMAGALAAAMSLAAIAALLVASPALHQGLGAALRLVARVPGLGVIARRTWAAALVVGAGAAAGGAVAAWVGRKTLAEVDLVPWFHVAALALATVALAALAAAGKPARWARLARTPGGARTVAIAAVPIVALLVAGIVLRTSSAARTAVGRAALVAVAATGLRTATDLDRDGYSSVFGGGDCAPFDAFIHPGARDLPANGVDEDCSGVDFVLGDRSADPPPVPLPATWRPPRHVLFITVDTLRASRLGFMGYAKDTSPALDALAKNGAVFARAFCAAPRTVRSIPAMMTGRYPSSIAWGKAGHDWEDVAESNETLAETLAKAGFRAAGFVLQKYFNEPHGLYQGMKMTGAADLAPYYLKDESGPSGNHITDGVIAHLRSLGAAEGTAPPAGMPRWFVWAHYYDPHIRFHASRYGTDRGAYYDESVRYTDDEIGRLLAFLKSAGLEDDTLVVFTTDHGQSLGDHGRVGHGSNLYDEVVRVPLVFAGPGVPAARHMTWVAEGVDLMPTILALVGVPAPAGIDGRSMAAAVAGGGAAPPPPAPDAVAYVEAMPDPRTDYDLRAFVRWPHKLVRDLASGSVEMYDLETDPAEKRDVMGADHALEEALGVALSSRVADGEWARALAPTGYVTLVPPSPPIPTNVLANPYVRVVGVDAKGARAGAAGEMALWLMPERPMRAAWKVRVSLVGPGACRVTADHEPAEGRHPTNHWQRGEYVIDRFKLRIPGACRGKAAALHVGLVGPGAPPYAGLALDDAAEAAGKPSARVGSGAATPPAGPPVAELTVP